MRCTGARQFALVAAPALLATGCFLSRDDSGASGSADACGDIDGSGGETGDVPNILGKWTTTFGTQTFYESCDIEGMGRDDMGWINGSAMEIKGRPPDTLYVIFDDPDEWFYGLENEFGGVVFTGAHEHKGYRLLASFGGLLFGNEYLDRDEIWGHGYIGVDSVGDGAIDCGLQGDFVAKKSGN